MFTAFLQNRLLQHLFGDLAAPTAATVYLSLHKADDSEISLAEWPAYARQPIVTDGTGFTITDNELVNAANLLFPRHDGAASVVVARAGIYTAATGGVKWVESDLSAARTIWPDDEIIFYAGELTLRVT